MTKASKTRFDEKTFKVRHEILEVIKKHKKGNELNGYVSYSPDGIVGPAFTSKSYTGINPTLSYSVMRDKVHREEELKNDYEIAKTVDAISKKYYDIPLNGLSVTYFTRGDFDFDTFLVEYKKEYGEDIDGSFVTSTGTQPARPLWNQERRESEMGHGIPCEHI